MKDKLTTPDPWITLIALFVTVIGVLVIWDAGFSRAAANGMVLPRELAYQTGFAIVSLVAGFAVSKINRIFWLKALPWMSIASLALLVAVEVPGVGKEINFAKRWIAIGPFTIQPSEIAKIVAIALVSLMVSTWISPALDTYKGWPQKLDAWVSVILRKGWPVGVVAIMFVFLEREKDMGTAAVLVAALMAILFASRLKRTSMVLLSVCTILVAVLLVSKEGYRSDRIVNHAHRWETSRRDSNGYQTTQSEIALARGGLTGVGFGNGRAKHNLPAPTTDFVLATLSEEFGLLGSFVCVGLLGCLSLRLGYIGLRQKDLFSRSIHIGVAVWIAVQSTLNILMVNGTIPPVGVPLPFITYGGSSLLSLWLALGLCQSLQTANRPKLEESHETDRDGWRHGRTRFSGA